MKKVWPILVFLVSTSVLAQGRQFATELTPAAGPPATVADIMAARAAAHGAANGTPHGKGPQVIIQSASLEGFLLPAAINAPGRNNTFFRTDFFVTNNRLATQEVLIAWLPQGISAAGQGAARFTLAGNTVYLLGDFLSAASGNLNKTGVGSILVTGVISGTNIVDTNAILEGGDRIWTFEPGSSGTNSFTMEAQFDDVFGTTTATASGLRQDAAFRSNVGIVNLDPTFAHTWTVRVTGTGQSTSFNVTVPALSMVQVAAPATFGPGFFFAEFTPDLGIAGQDWSAYGVTADNLTGDAWVSRATQQ